jgi:tripartite-type tricarboxylate transporter receptor subunit TctC
MKRLVFALLALFTLAATAQNYPAQSLRMIVAFPPGGGADIAARIVAMELGRELGQSVVVENVGGAGGQIGAQRAASAAPDGYTVFLGTPSTHGTNPAVYPKLSYDPVKDFAPIVLLGSSPFMLITRADMKASNVKELIAEAKARGGQMNYASYGNGSINHLIGELFFSMADIKAVHVPYKGGAPAMADLMAGRVDFTFDGSAALGPIRQGKAKVLAVGSPKRWSVLPDVPTVSEAGVPGFEAFTWYALFAPAATPKPIIDVLNAKANAALKSESAKDQFAKQSIDPIGGTPAQLAAHVQNEIGKWVKVAKAKNITIAQ